jgi:protein tyrosine phosphatase (PTP) superfamily phosphohydrolase (DUF442 family)
MPSDPITPPSIKDQQDDILTAPSSPAASPDSAPAPAPPIPTATIAPRLHFSFTRWASTGVVRLLYRFWTRVAAHLFPEDSPGERVAQALHIPLPDRLNLSWVNSHLAVGGRIRPEDIRALARVGVTHVIDTRAEHCDDAQALAREQIDLLYLPTPDTKPLSVEQLMQGSAWAQECIQKGGRVLVHCEHGVGRSVLLTCAVLVYDGMHAYDALQLVQYKRWQAAPNHRQISRLKEFEAACAARRGASKA